MTGPGGVSPEARAILLVEDDPDVLDALREAIEYEGFTVASAGNGQEALDYLRHHVAPSLVLLDLMMPVMSGLQFLEVARRDPALREIPVLLLSAQPLEALQETARRTGATGALAKPVQLEPLLAVVQRFCGPGADAKGPDGRVMPRAAS